MDAIGGYRLVRLLGAGSKADVWLGHARTADAGMETVAVKVYRPEAAQADIDTEIEALARSSHRHLVRLEDLATAPDGTPSLILQRLSAVTLRHLLAAGPLAPGEAVTVLAPLALAVAELHRVGVTHGAIRASAVLFDGEGAPVLARFGSAGILGELPSTEDVGFHPAQLADAPGVAEDLTRLAGVCRAALGEAADALGDWSSYRASPDPQAWTLELADRLFDLAEPVPVSFGRGGVPAGSTMVPPRVGGEAPEVVELAETPSSTSGPWHDALALLHLPDSLVAAAGKWGAVLESGPVATLRPRVLTGLRSVRKSVWVVAAVVAILVAAAITLLPAAGSDAGQPGVAPARESTRGSTPSAPDSATTHPDILADEPVAAGVALLGARADCIREASILCLDHVDQAGSAAMEADAYRVRIVQEGGIESPEPSIVGIAPTLVDRLGDSALLSLDRAGSAVGTLLLVRTEQGWRIRDLVFASDAATAEPGGSTAP